MATGACVENVHYLNVVRVNTLTSYGVAVTLVAPIQHPFSTTCTLGFWQFWGSKLLSRVPKPGGPIGTSDPRKKPPFIPKEGEETFRTSVGPIVRAGDPPTAKVTYYGPLHMGPNL